MSSRVTVSLPLALLAIALSCQGQAWKPILDSSRAIGWSNAGVGGIPARPKLCATLTPVARLAQINAALGSCPRGQTVFLAAGM